MYSGLTGKIFFWEEDEERVIGYISNWSIEDTTDIIEFSELGRALPTSGFKIKKAGLQSWSASADGAVYFEDGTNHDKLFDLKAAREIIKLQIHLNAETYFAGEGYIESLSVDLSAEDKGNISISISGNDKLSLYKGGELLNPEKDK